VRARPAKRRLRPALALALALAGVTAVAAPAVAQPPATAPPPLPPASGPPAPATGAPAAGKSPGAAGPGAGALPASGPGPRPAAQPPPPTAAPLPALVEPPEPPSPSVPRVVPTADAVAAATDHDAVVGAWGVEVRRIEPDAPVFARRFPEGCATPPAGGGAECPSIRVGALAVRHWLGRNLALTGGLAFAAGGGKDGDRLLDTHFGVGPLVGVSVLLGNWRHLAISASPDLTVVLLRPAGSAGTAYLVDLRADLEGELHLGFFSLPALSIAIRSGVGFRLEHAGDVTGWSAGVSGATTLWGVVSALLLRYYF
jgi:hypothetical protein